MCAVRIDLRMAPNKTHAYKILDYVLKITYQPSYLYSIINTIGLVRWGGLLEPLSKKSTHMYFP